MSNSYVFPGGVNTYVPQLSADLVVEFSRNPNKFPIAEYCDYRIVDKPRGYYVKMLNDGQARVVNDNDNVWADGADTPVQVEGNDEFTFPPYDCIRRRLPKTLGQLSVDVAGWDILDQAARLLAMQQMTARVKRIHSVLTTSGNWGANYATATTAGGGVWSSATNLLPYIRKSLAYAQIAIQQATLGVVAASDLYIVMNPNVARVVATSQEFLAFISQQPSAVQIWEASEQFKIFGIPDTLLGIRCIVDNTTYNSALPGATASLAFTLSDSYVVILSKQKAVNSAAGGAFSTYSPFVFEDMVTEVFNEPQHRRYHVYVTENIDTSSNALVSPQSGFLVKIDS